ncbi:MAG: thioredoxin domain-containing protein [Patescibacteria group bacterium]
MHHTKTVFLLLFATALIVVLFFVALNKTSQITITRSTVPLISDNSFNIPIDSTDPQYGNPGAPVTVIEFADISCSKCQKTYYAIHDFVSKHPLDIQMVWKDAPRSNVLFSGDVLAHQAAQCAGKQGKFFEFINIAMQNTSHLDEAGLRKIAEGLGLNVTTWWDCTNSDEIKNKVQTSVDLAGQLGIKDLPAVYINNRAVLVNADIDVAQLLNQAIQKPEAQPTTDNTTSDTNLGL